MRRELSLEQLMGCPSLWIECFHSDVIYMKPSGGILRMGARDTIYIPPNRTSTKQMPLFEELEDGNLIPYKDE